MKLEIGALKNSGFLLQLWEKISEEVPCLFCQYVDVFLSVVRDSDHTEASEYQV